MKNEEFRSEANVETSGNKIKNGCPKAAALLLSTNYFLSFWGVAS